MVLPKLISAPEERQNPDAKRLWAPFALTYTLGWNNQSEDLLGPYGRPNYIAAIWAEQVDANNKVVGSPQGVGQYLVQDWIPSYNGSKCEIEFPRATCCYGGLVVPGHPMLAIDGRKAVGFVWNELKLHEKMNGIDKYPEGTRFQVVVQIFRYSPTTGEMVAHEKIETFGPLKGRHLWQGPIFIRVDKTAKQSSLHADAATWIKNLGYNIELDKDGDQYCSGFLGDREFMAKAPLGPL